MVSQSKRLENALRGCAEAGVSDTVDLWPAVKERATGTRAGAEAGEGTIAGNGARRRFRFPRLVPNTPLGWTLAVVSVLILGVSLYAAAGSVGALYWRGVPGTVEPGSDKEADQRLGTKLDENLSVLREELNVTKARDGVRLTLEWAYAEQGYVAVGLHTQRLEGSRKTRQDDDILFQPSLWDDTVGNEAEFSPYTRITDASGQDFDTVGGGTLLGPDREEADATFDAPEGLEPGRKHRFRLEVPLIEEFRMGSSVDEPIGKPFVFDFEVPVRPAPTIEVDQKARARGTTLTLDRVVDSPVMPQAVVCFEPPDNAHQWMPLLKDEGFYPEVGDGMRQLEDGCWTLGMPEAIEGRTSVVVSNLEGMPKDPAPTPSGSINPKTIRGPWTFEFAEP